MFKAEKGEVILGEKVLVHWDFSKLSRFSVLSIKCDHPSHLRVKRTQRISRKGSIEVTVSQKKFVCELRKLTIFGFKTLASYEPSVRIVELDLKTKQVRLPNDTFQFSKMNEIRLKRVNINNCYNQLLIPSIDIHLPNVKEEV